MEKEIKYSTKFRSSTDIHQYLKVNSISYDVLRIEQSYLCIQLEENPTWHIRIRKTSSSDIITYILTTKIATDQKYVREEVELVISRAAYNSLLQQAITDTIIKDRYVFVVEGTTWEVDVFLDRNSNIEDKQLIIAECEFNEDIPSAVPSWIEAPTTLQNIQLVSYK